MGLRETKELQRKIFKVFEKGEGGFNLYCDIIKLLEDTTMDYVCKNKVGQYLFLTKLSNSMNNAGHEERRSEDISKINKKEHELIEFIKENNREHFLP